MSHSTRTCAAIAFPLVLALACTAQTLAPANPDPAKARAVIQPADNLVASGLPEIPAEIADAAGRYTEFRTANLAAWHPTRREMLITTRFGDSPQVHEVRCFGRESRLMRPGIVLAGRSRTALALRSTSPSRIQLAGNLPQQARDSAGDS